MSNNWSFVITGYSITAVSLAGYLAWVKLRARQLRRSLSDETDD